MLLAPYHPKCEAHWKTVFSSCFNLSFQSCGLMSFVSVSTLKSQFLLHAWVDIVATFSSPRKIIITLVIKRFHIYKYLQMCFGCQKWPTNSWWTDFMDTNLSQVEKIISITWYEFENCWRRWRWQWNELVWGFHSNFPDWFINSSIPHEPSSCWCYYKFKCGEFGGFLNFVQSSTWPRAFCFDQMWISLDTTQTTRKHCNSA